ncbi:MAG TPA: saccharopine dehydrogenase NADP-binding domain-containing protein [Acidimicrobiales bacterium]
MTAPERTGVGEEPAGRTPPQPAPTARVVIVGGYGHVGRRLAAALRDHRSVVVAGRRAEAAERAATELGVAAAPGAVDARTGDGLAAVVRPGDVVVNAAGDDREARLLRQAIELGAHYTDLTADPRAIAAMLDLDAEARAAGTSALVGIGLAPGATNVLARAALDRLPEADHLDVGLLLSLADGFGPQAVDWTLGAIATPLAMEHGGHRTDVVAFRQRRRLPFGPLGTVPVYEFGFPEQVFLPASLGVPSVRGWFTLAPTPVTRALALTARTRAARAFLGRPRVRRGLVRLAGRLPGSRRGGIVGATAVARHGDRTARVSLRARSEARTTARCAAALIDLWDVGQAGCHLPEAVIPPAPFFAALAAAGVEVTRSPAP